MSTVIRNIWLYHITNIKNLPSILSNGSLQSFNALTNSGLSYQNIAYDHIQERRSKIEVPCGLGGTLHDYVPFYFGPRSPMLYAIYKNMIDGYTDGQNAIIHLVTTIQNIIENNTSFVFTDGHAAMAFTQFYDNLDDIDKKVDLNLMKEKYWSDTDKDPDRKRRRQAEFLIYETCSWDVIRGIGVFNNSSQQQVVEILAAYSLQTPVQVVRHWYY